MAGPGRLADALRQRALDEGFSLAGIASVDASDHTGFYRSWLDRAFHGEMAYLARADSVARRGDPLLTMADARSVLMVAHEYYLEDPPGLPDDPARAVIARYARGSDYHDVVLAKLRALLAWLDSEAPGGAWGRPYVDTGPILERELAERAGLGWFGRNTMLIHPARGSWFFLGVLLLDIELPVTTDRVDDRCGTCRACLDACPTGALLGREDDGAPVIDARRCISYLTIELRGAIPRALRAGVGNRVFGCDICQEVCPWNQQFARPTEAAEYRPRAGLDGPELTELASRLLGLDEAGFREAFRGSPLTRARRDGLLRNVCVALGNWGGAEALPPLARALRDGSPLVRGHAVWALGRLGIPEAMALLGNRVPVEDDPSVVAELRSALDDPVVS